MKTGFIGLDLPEGKVKFNDEVIEELEKKFAPKKVAYYFFELIKGEIEKCEVIIIARDQILDLLIPDIEKFETRLTRTTDENEKKVIERCLEQLGQEKPVCDMVFTEEEAVFIKLLSPLSCKPVLVLDEKSPDLNSTLKKLMEKAEVMFFYTAGKPEVRSWFVKKGSDIVTCAGKIHTDLAKGFIKADIVNLRDMRNAHNLQDARSKGLAKLVDRDYIIQEGDIVEIRFNV